MRNIQTFQVFPFIPEPLAFLETLVRNIWWCWQRDAVELFRRIDPGLWNDCGGNPIQFFTRIPQERLEELAGSFDGVDRVFAMQAGREVRVVVDPGELDDLASAELARKIARRLEEDLQYPGQIGVTVIREFRASDYAR